MEKNFIEKVPRYFEPYVNDCFHNAYGAVLQYMGLNPNIILADYLSFMYDSENGNIGVNYLYRYSTTVEFKEEELNTSLEFAYVPATATFSPEGEKDCKVKFPDRVNISMFINDDSHTAHARLKSLIDSGRPVVAAVDLFHMSYHRAYQREHGLHCVVITGYDEKEGCFELFDKYRLSSSDFEGKLPIEEVKLGRASHNPATWSADTIKRPVRNLWIEICAHKDFGITDKKLLNVLEESCNRLNGLKQVLCRECGFKALEAFTKDLLAKQEEALDDNQYSWFRYHLNISFKNISRNRKRFMAFLNEISALLPGQACADACVKLEEASKHWDIAASIALKIGIKKSPELIGDLAGQLRTIRELEGCVAEKLESCLKAKMPAEL